MLCGAAESGVLLACEWSVVTYSARPQAFMHDAWTAFCVIRVMPPCNAGVDSLTIRQNVDCGRLGPRDFCSGLGPWRSECRPATVEQQCDAPVRHGAKLYAAANV